METTYRPLNNQEIKTLQRNGCIAFAWSQIEVAEPFVVNNIKNSCFGGWVRIGRNVCINNAYIDNYDIGDEVYIRDVESLIADPESTFGNGVKVSVLNEAGGREVPLYNGLTAQIAYLSAMYRHRPEAVAAIDRLITAEISLHGLPARGKIGAESAISSCGELTDVCIGEGAVIQGVTELTNGTVNSTAESPTRIGRGVILRDFIVADGAQVTDNVHAERCFIGQGCRLGKGFTATDSIFFANCECEQGEACAVFAGPYTVTHHKSTLLIGGMFSFYNAGSGTNMSNHMYRLGPVHQGVMERGCKTGSGSYMLFPMHVGAFSTVLGKHDGHADTRHLPFSYLTEREGKTVVLAGQALKGVGLARDLRKWPERDRRKGVKRDHITFDGLNPYTISQIINGLHSPDVGRGREIYQTALDAWLGDVVLERLKSNEKLHENHGCNNQSHPECNIKWVDLAGLIAPAAEVERLLERLPEMGSIFELSSSLTEIYDRYDDWRWAYARALMGGADLSAVVARGVAASEKILAWQLADAAKEYAANMRVSYASDDEFTAIHGVLENHPFLARLRREMEEKAADYQKIKMRFSGTF